MEVGGRRKREDENLLPATEELYKLSQDKLKDIIKTVSNVQKTKYKRRSYKKYGSLNKGFTEAELKKFFMVCKNEKAKLAFYLMAYLGLRVGEVDWAYCKKLANNYFLDVNASENFI